MISSSRDVANKKVTDKQCLYGMKRSLLSRIIFYVSRQLSNMILKLALIDCHLLPITIYLHGR